MTRTQTDWWRGPKKKPCWVCSKPTHWIYLDMGHQHPDCDQWPDPVTGTDHIVINGKEIS